MLGEGASVMDGEMHKNENLVKRKKTKFLTRGRVIVQREYVQCAPPNSHIMGATVNCCLPTVGPGGRGLIKQPDPAGHSRTLEHRSCVRGEGESLLVQNKA